MCIPPLSRLAQSLTSVALASSNAMLAGGRPLLLSYLSRRTLADDQATSTFPSRQFWRDAQTTTIWWDQDSLYQHERDEFHRKLRRNQWLDSVHQRVAVDLESDPPFHHKEHPSANSDVNWLLSKFTYVPSCMNTIVLWNSLVVTVCMLLPQYTLHPPHATYDSCFMVSCFLVGQ